MRDLQSAFDRLDEFVEQRLAARNLAGVAIALTDCRQLLRVSTYGFADLASQRPVASDTLFEIGSISKSFTALALLQLVEEGRLDLHKPIAAYLPWFSVQSPYEPITTHHLLTHTSGLVRGTEFTAEGRAAVRALRETETGFPPGTQFHYSNDGYKLLGILLEELTDQSYGEAIRRRVLEPLEMQSSEPVITHDTRKRLAVGYERLYDDRPPHRSHPLVPATWIETGTGDGSIASTANDMACYVRALMNGGKGPTGRLVSEASFALMMQPAIEVPGNVFCDYDLATGEPRQIGIDTPERQFYGYGLDLSTVDGHAYLGHNGGMLGYVSSILADLQDGLGAVVLVNAPESPGEVARFALQLMRAVLHDGELPPMPETPDPFQVDDAAGYVGEYRSTNKQFELAAEGKQLILHIGTARVALERRGLGRFYVAHPDWDRFLLHFGREGGQVREAVHGPDWYLKRGSQAPKDFDYPPEWDAYPGHYRSYNPWLSNFRVILRKGRLIQISPSGEESVLIPEGDGAFRVGEEAHLPERIRFDTIEDGRALQAILVGGSYYRTFTP